MDAGNVDPRETQGGRNDRYGRGMHVFTCEMQMLLRQLLDLIVELGDLLVCCSKQP